MAGSYPDAPAPRMAWDDDGSTFAFVEDTGVITSLSSAQAKTVNDEFGSFDGNSSIFTADSRSGYYAIIFPELRDITHYYLSFNNAGDATVFQKSANTTNGFDGTWTNITATATSNSSGTSPGYRNSILTSSNTGVKGLRLRRTGPGNRQLYSMHIFGTIPAANSPDRLIVTDTSGSQIAAQLDFGDTARGTNQTKQFKVTNNSSTLTATSITISLQANTDASPTLIGQYQLSTDNSTFANSINIGSLAPSASSAALYIKDTVALNATLGLWAARIQASAASWI